MVIANPLCEKFYQITACDPQQGHQTVYRKGIPMLKPMPGPPWLLWAKTQDTEDLNIVIELTNIGISVVQDIMFVPPKHVASANEIEREAHEPIQAFAL